MPRRYAAPLRCAIIIRLRQAAADALLLFRHYFTIAFAFSRDAATPQDAAPLRHAARHATRGRCCLLFFFALIRCYCYYARCAIISSLFAAACHATRCRYAYCLRQIFYAYRYFRRRYGAYATIAAERCRYAIALYAMLLLWLPFSLRWHGAFATLLLRYVCLRCHAA